MTHITHSTAKKLKEFLGESAPEPIKSEMGQIWLYDMECPEDGILQGVSLTETDAPAYQLHDLLSKPFCEAMGAKSKVQKWLKKNYLNRVRGSYDWAMEFAACISSEYTWIGGLPAVEAALVEMMEGK